MQGDSCRLPSHPGDHDWQVVCRMLAGRRIAIVGLSDNPARPSYGIAQYLLAAGKEVIPVNPNHTRVLGLKCYPTLESVPGKIDVVNVFRKPENCLEVTEAAIAVGARGIWLQSGIINEQARALAKRAGIDFVQNRCIMVDHMSRA